LALEAALWCGIALIVPFIWEAYRSQIQTRLGQRYEILSDLLPWLHGLFLPFTAVIVGSIPAGPAGLRSQSPTAWLIGITACVLGLISAALVLSRRQIDRDALVPAGDILHEEPRWAMYRTAGYLWVGSLLPAVGIGIALAATEVALSYLPRRGDGGPPVPLLSQMIRATFSGVIFIATQNFWLTMGTQAGVLLIAWWFQRAQQDTGDT
jgi:hypothetical protein